MKKNYIQNQAKDAENKILEDNTDFYNSVKSKYYPNKTANKRIHILRLSYAVVVGLILIICLSVVLAKVLDNDLENDTNKNYLFQNEKNTVADLFELNGNLNDIFLDIDNNAYEFNIVRVYDSISGDNLYFVMNIEGSDFIENIEMYFFINPDYKHINKLEGNEIKTIQVNSLDIKYIEDISEDSDGLFNLNYIAQIDDNKSVIYIEYEQSWDENSTNFFNFLEQTIKSK